MSKHIDSNSSESGVLKGEEGLLLKHSYDGIHELDHVLPTWWVWLFNATIVFAVGYAAYYMTGIGPSSTEELATTMAKIEAMRPAAGGGGDEAALLAALTNPEMQQKGHEVYMGKCMACHGEKGQGVIGPNLTDDYWIHGTGTPQDIVKAIVEGFPDKGMPPWGPLMTTEEIQQAVAFIYSIHGSNPAGAKPPQGELHAKKE